VRQQNSGVVKDFILPYSAVFIATNPKVKELLKSVHIWQKKYKSGTFLWPTVYNVTQHALTNNSKTCTRSRIGLILGLLLARKVNFDTVVILNRTLQRSLVWTLWRYRVQRGRQTMFSGAEFRQFSPISPIQPNIHTGLLF